MEFKAKTPSQQVYVSITGLQLKRPWHIFRFFRHAIRVFQQAKSAPGNLKTEVKNINGVRHTLTVWQSAEHMRAFLYSGAHQKAIKVFPLISTGKTLGYETDQVPNWDEVHKIWKERGVEYK